MPLQNGTYQLGYMLKNNYLHKGSTMKRTVIITLLALLPLLSACNTMEGLGEDTQKAGHSLAKSADDNK